MSIFSDLIGTLKQSFKVGVKGVVLKNKTGTATGSEVLQVRNTTDAAFANVEMKDLSANSVASTTSVSATSVAVGASGLAVTGSSVLAGVVVNGTSQLSGDVATIGLTTHTGNVNVTGEVTATTNVKARTSFVLGNAITTTFVPATTGASTTLKMPGSAGASGQVLSTDGSGNLAWATRADGTNYVAKIGDTMTGALVVSNVTNAVRAQSGTASVSTGFSVGRTGFDGFWSVAGANDSYLLGSVPGDVTYNSTTGRLLFGVGSVPAVIVGTNNFVGFGRTPLTNVDVQGAAPTTGSVSIRLTETTSSTSVGLHKTGATYSYSGVGANEAWLYSQGSSNLAIGPDGAGLIKFIANGAARGGWRDGQFYIGPVPAFSTVPFLTQVATNRNVGIFDQNSTAAVGGFTDAGAAAPLRVTGARLSFSGSGSSEQMSLSTAGSFGLGLTPGADAAYKIDARGAGATPVIAATSTDGTTNTAYMQANAAVDVRFGGLHNVPVGLYQNGTEVIRMDTFKNVTVGSNGVAGSAKLSVIKNSVTLTESTAGIYLASAFAANNTGLILGTDNTLNSAYIQSLEPGVSWSNRPLILQPNAGNVGIGTQTPLRALSIGGRANTDMVLKSTASSGGAGNSTLYFGNNATDAAGWVTYEHVSNVLELGPAGTARIRINSTNDMIFGGTGSPYSSSGRSTITINGSSTALLALTTNGTASSYLFGTASSTELMSLGTLTFGSGGVNNRIVVGANGNVGVGMSPSAFMFSVNGGIMVNVASESIRLQHDSGYISYYNSGNTSRTGYIQMITGSTATFSAENCTAYNVNIGGGTRQVIGADGRVMFNGIHNNGNGAAGGQFLASGSYTPSMSNGFNVSSFIPRKAVWTRVGNIVTVSGSCSVTISATNVTTILNIALPIPSDLQTSYDVSGIASQLSDTSTTMSATYITGDAAANVATVVWSSASVAGSREIRYTYQYEVF